MSSFSSYSNSTLPNLDHLSPDPSSSSDQLCYVHCNFCDTVLAVSVPCSSLLKMVTVRCGQCTTLLPVNMRALLLPPPAAAANSANQLHLGHLSSLLSPLSHHNHLLLEEINPNRSPNLVINPAAVNNLMSDFPLSARIGSPLDELPKLPIIKRTPEKKQRVPSAYNRFIKDEIQRIKAENPHITHREAFSAAAKNWAHFPHIHFGLMSADQTTTTSATTMRQQDITGDILMKDGFLASKTNIGVAPYL